MKICEYCGSENEDKALVCTSCGGNSFRHRCPNCGTEFSDGLYCPKCGVMAGQKPKKCPRCGTEYYTDVCPSCGYFPGMNYKNRDDDETEEQQPVEEHKKRHTALWILGWIFIFPVPLTVLIARSHTLPKWAKGLLIAAVWIVFLVLIDKNSGA